LGFGVGVVVWDLGFRFGAGGVQGTYHVGIEFNCAEFGIWGSGIGVWGLGHKI